MVSTTMGQVFVDEKELNKARTPKEADETGLMFLDIRLGGAVPVGQFASKNLRDSISGYALTGSIFELMIRYKFNPLLSGQFGFATQSNRFDSSPFENEIATTFRPVYPDLRWNSEAGNWLMNMIVAGVGLSSNSKPFEVEGQILGGVAFQKSPEIYIAGSSALGRIEFYQTESKDVSPVIGFRGDIAYHFDRVRLGLFLGGWFSEGNFSSDLYINGNYINSGNFINRFYSVTTGVSLSMRIKN